MISTLVRLPFANTNKDIANPPPLPQVLIQKRNQQSFYLKFPISILSNLVDQKVILLYLEALSKYLRLSTGRVCAQSDHFKSPRMALVANREEASVWMSQVSSGISWMSIRFAKSIYGGNSLDLAKILLSLARSHHISSNKDQIWPKKALYRLRKPYFSRESLISVENDYL